MRPIQSVLSFEQGADHGRGTQPTVRSSGLVEYADDVFVVRESRLVTDVTRPRRPFFFVDAH